MPASDKAEKIHGELQAAVAELTSSEDWLRAMGTAAKFHRYSFGNVLLIASQRPSATRVAGYQAWKGLGRQVRRGERGISILAPMVSKRTETDETGEESSVKILRGFRVVHVFDVSQTDGEPLAQIPRPSTELGSAPVGVVEGLERFAAGLGYRVEYGTPSIPDALGECDHEKRLITVATGDSARIAKTLCHEVAHALMHQDRGEYAENRGRCEVEAESVAYVVLKALGVETSDYTVPYVAGWSRGDAATVVRTGERVVSTARGILDGLQATEAKAA